MLKISLQGSGKTLAFGIPLIHHILRLKDAADPDQESSCDMTDELSGEKEPQLDDDQEDDHDRPPEEEELVDSEVVYSNLHLSLVFTN